MGTLVGFQVAVKSRIDHGSHHGISRYFQRHVFKLSLVDPSGSGKFIIETD